jgi:hypothetical protein
VQVSAGRRWIWPTASAAAVATCSAPSTATPRPMTAPSTIKRKAAGSWRPTTPSSRSPSFPKYESALLETNLCFSRGEFLCLDQLLGRTWRVAGNCQQYSRTLTIIISNIRFPQNIPHIDYHGILTNIRPDIYFITFQYLRLNIRENNYDTSLWYFICNYSYIVHILVNSHGGAEVNMLTV